MKIGLAPVPAEDFLIVYDVESDGAACLHDGGATLLIDGAGTNGFERGVLPSLRHGRGMIVLQLATISPISPR